jgi:hypothetical protein
VARFSNAVKDRTQLSTEGGTCGPFAIIAAEKLDQCQWVIRYLHTGSHGAAVVYQRGNPNVLYLMDSTLRSVYSIPPSRFLWSTGNHSYSVHQNPPHIPYAVSPVILRSANDHFYYAKKGGNKFYELCSSSRGHLIERPIDAIYDGPLEPVLLIRNQVANGNRFRVCII